MNVFFWKADNLILEKTSAVTLAQIKDRLVQNFCCDFSVSAFNVRKMSGFKEWVKIASVQSKREPSKIYFATDQCYVKRQLIVSSWKSSINLFIYSILHTKTFFSGAPFSFYTSPDFAGVIPPGLAAVLNSIG